MTSFILPTVLFILVCTCLYCFSDTACYEYYLFKDILYFSQDSLNFKETEKTTSSSMDFDLSV